MQTEEDAIKYLLVLQNTEHHTSFWPSSLDIWTGFCVDNEKGLGVFNNYI